MSAVFNYAGVQASADRLIAKFGQAATLTNTDMTGAVTSRAAQAVVLGPVKHTLGNSGIAIGDYRIILDHTAAPVAGQRITFGSESRVIVDPVNPIQPGNTVLGYEIYARLG